MRSLFSIALVLLAVMMVTAEASMKKKDKGKEPKAEAECSEWQYEKCVPNSGDCGAGIREATCNEQTRKTKCKVPCNWKRDFGADCKYKFGRWSECDTTTGTRNRSGTLKKALFNVQCQMSIMVSKPCTPKTPKPKNGEKKKGKGKEN
ncbi:midkine b [Triplophysa dalaica]|uniref:midkine b n=1 Tax=Triplophysa dalaica TaxID=1582913 RepID=UPI0024DF6F41|nr:midkine b [Triplophysa dalaica]